MVVMRAANLLRRSESSTSLPSRNRLSRVTRSYSFSSASASLSFVSFQSAFPKTPSFGISSMTRYLRTARSTMVAVTSSGFAAKSTSVPTWPGRSPSGGTNSTGVSVCSISGSISSAGVPPPAAR